MDFPIKFTMNVVDNVSGGANNIKSSINGLAEAFSTAAGVMIRDFVNSAMTSVISSLGEAGREFRDYELTLAKILSATNAVGEEAEKLGAELKKASEAQTALGYSGREASSALESLVKAGMQGEQATEALAASLSLARLEGMNTDAAAGLLVQTLTMFNLKAEDSSLALDAISRAADAGIGTAADYATGLANCGAMANNMGLSLEETLASLVMLDKTFGSAVESGTFLNAMFKDLVAKADDLGLELYNADGSMQSLNEIIMQLKENVGKYGDDQEAINEYLSVFDIRAQKAVIGLINYDGKISDVTESMGDARSVQEKLDMVMGTTAGSIAEMQARLENANYALGEATTQVELLWKEFALSLGPIGGVVDALGPSMLQGAMTGLITIMPQLIQQHQSLALAAGAAVGAFTATYSILNMVPEPMRQTAAVLAIVIGALIAATIAAAAFYGTISLGAAVPGIIAGIATAVAGVTVLIGGLEQKTYDAAEANDTYTNSLKNAADAVNSYKIKLSELSAAYEKSLVDEETFFSSSLEGLRLYFTDKYGTTQTELTRLEDEINKYYNECIVAAQESYTQRLSAGETYFDILWSLTSDELGVLEEYVNAHYDRLIEDADSAYEDELTAAKDYFADLWGLTSDKLGGVEAYVEAHYKNELSTIKKTHSEQISELHDYYDELIAASKNRLTELQSENKAEMNALEIEYLERKAAIEDANRNPYSGEVNRVSIYYMNDMLALEEWYAKQKSELQDKHKLAELKVEQEVNEELAGLEQQKINETLNLQEQQNIELAKLEEQRQADMQKALQLQEEAKLNHNLKLAELESQRQADLESAQEMQLNAYNDFNEELKVIEEQRLADLLYAQSETERLTQEHHQRLLAMERSYLKTKGELVHGEESAKNDIEYLAGELDKQVNKPEDYMFPWLLDESEYPEPAPNWTRSEPTETWYRNSSNGASTTIVYEDAGFVDSTNKLFQKAVNRFDKIPRMAEGGFVSEPTLAMVGEAGAEVILPVDSFNDKAAGNTYNISVPINIQGSVDEKTFRRLKEELKSVLIEATSSSGKTSRIRKGGMF